MARVTLIGPLKSAAGDPAPFEVDASTVRQLLHAVVVRHPGISALIDDGVAVAVDGEILQDAWFAPVGPDSEVHILPPIAGG